MLAIHRFTIHAICPFVEHQQWDYYDVELQTEEVIDVHILETAMNSVRGIRESQEAIATILREQLPCEVLITISGRHSLTSSTTVRA